MKIKRRYKILIVILAFLFVLLVVFIVGASMYFEPIAAKMIVSQLNMMDLKAKIGDLKIGILRGEIDLSELDLKTSDDKQLLSSRKISVNLNFLKAIRGNIFIDRIALDGFDAKGILDKEGKLNWLTIIEDIPGEKPAEAKPVQAKKKPSFGIGKVELSEFSVVVGDMRQPAGQDAVAVTVKELKADLGGGGVSAKKLVLTLPEQAPFLSIESLAVEGDFGLTSGKPPKITSVKVSGIFGRNRLNENGRLFVQEWAESTAKANGFMKEEEVAEAPPAAKSEPVELPESVEIDSVNLSLHYPSGHNLDWSEQVILKRLTMDNKANRIQIEGLEWHNSAEHKIHAAVVVVGSLSVSGPILSASPQIDEVEIKGLEATLFKKVRGPFEVLQRLDVLTALFPKPKTPETKKPQNNAPAMKISGPFGIEALKIRIVEEDQETTYDNILQWKDLKVDLAKGDVNLAELALSDEKGGFEKSPFKIGSIETKANLAVPPPDRWKVENLVVSSPAIATACSAKGELDLIKRLTRMTATAPESASKPAPASTAPSKFALDMQSLEVKNLQVDLTHQASESRSVQYLLQEGTLNVTGLLYPEGRGTQMTVADFKSKVVLPTSGNIELSAQAPQKSFTKDFTAKFLMSLADVTKLDAYYENELPFGLEAGQFKFTTEGQCKDSQLDFPYEVRIESPKLVAKEDSSKLNILKGVSRASSQVVLEGLKNEAGFLVYNGKIGGTLTNPDFGSPWKSMGKLFTGRLTDGLKSLPGVKGTLNASKGVLKGTTTGAMDEAGKVGDTLKNLVPFGKKK